MTEKKQKRKPRSYTDEFKQQLVLLYQNGKRKCDICREYDIATSLLDKWLKHLVLSMKKITVHKNSKNSCSFVNETAS